MTEAAPARRTLQGLGVAVGLAALVALSLLSLRFGVRDVTAADVWRAISDFDASSQVHTVIRELRLPRTVFAIASGCALGVCGAVMQAVTRNPMADPFIFGISGGASFALTTAVYAGITTTPAVQIWFAFGGAALSAIIVAAIGGGGKGGGSPLRLVLAGVITATLMTSWTGALIYLDEDTQEQMMFLLLGNVAGRPLEDYGITIIFMVLASAALLVLAHQLNVLNLGEDRARAAGMNTGRTRLICSVLVVIATGASVAAVGPIGFVGLAVPHMVRSITGPDYRWVLVYSAIYGALILLLADLVGRVIAERTELAAGIVMGLVGAPFFVYLARRRSVNS